MKGKSMVAKSSDDIARLLGGEGMRLARVSMSMTGGQDLTRVKETNEAFTIRQDYIRALLHQKQRSGAKHIRSVFKGSKRICGHTFAISIYDKDYYDGWRGWLKEKLIRWGIIEE